MPLTGLRENARFITPFLIIHVGGGDCCCHLVTDFCATHRDAAHLGARPIRTNHDAAILFHHLYLIQAKTLSQTSILQGGLKELRHRQPPGGPPHANAPSAVRRSVSLACQLSNMSHRRTVLSQEALARTDWMGLKLRQLTGPSWPPRTWRRTFAAVRSHLTGHEIKVWTRAVPPAVCPSAWTTERSQRNPELRRSPALR